MSDKSYTTAKDAETAILVAVNTKTQDAEQVTEYLDELAFLAETMRKNCYVRIK